MDEDQKSEVWEAVNALWLAYTAYDAVLDAGGTIHEAVAARDSIFQSYEIAEAMADLAADGFIEFYLEEEFGREKLFVKRTDYFEEVYGTDPDNWPTDI